MLVLTRKVGEQIIIGDDIRLIVVEIQGDKIRLGVCAPKRVVIDRLEVHERRKKDVADHAGLKPGPSLATEPLSDGSVARCAGIESFVRMAPSKKA